MSGNVSVLAAGVTIYVDDDNTGGPWDGSLANPYQYIQEGINAASDGDTVHVFDGTYVENVVANKSITLEGEPKPVINGMGGIGINVTINDGFAYGVTVDGFDITASSYGVYLRMENIQNLYDTSVTLGDIVVANNAISSSLDGIYVSVNHIGFMMYGDSLVTMGDFRVSDNVINSGLRGIFVEDFSGIGYYMYNSSSFAMGNLEFSNNRIDSVFEGLSLGDIDSFGYGMYDNSTFMMGSIVMNNNTITSDYNGIGISYFGDFGEDMHGNSSFTMGHIQANDNIINSGYDGIYVDDITYFAYYMEDNSSFTMGNIEFNGNIINSTHYGIYAYDLAYEFGYDMHSNSSFTMGHIQANDNIINSGYDGIYVEYIEYFGYYMYGESTFVMGNIEVSGNTINSTNYGIYLYEIDYLGYQMYDDSSFTMGDFLVNDNIINSDNYGMYLEYIEYFGYVLYGNSSFTMGNVQINGNVVNSAQRGIFIEDLYEFGAYMHDTSSFTMSNIEISGNRINSTLQGIHIQSFYHAYYMYNNASFTMEDVYVSDNIINSKDNGIVLREIWHHTRFGYNVIDNATIITGNVEFGQNEITGGIDGLDLADLENATIRNNMMQNCSLGFYLQDSANNSIYHNNFINNTLQAYVRALYTSTPNCNNTWDNGYPSGGNYWSDYTGVDLYSGPDQNIPGSDFRGDTPYIINQNNTDRYPLTIPYETQPPIITILSPENKTYAVDTDIQLTFTPDEPVDWIGYSLNDQAIVTIAENITLPTLPVGWHRVTVYANDTFNNMGMSTVYFTVLDMTDPIANAGQDQTVIVGETVAFDASSSSDNVGIASYEWNFGDETTGTGKTTTHEYTNAGTYTVTLTVKDAAGNQATDTMSVTVNPTEAFPWWIVAAAGIIAAGTAVAAVFLWRRRRKKG